MMFITNKSRLQAFLTKSSMSRSEEMWARDCLQVVDRRADTSQPSSRSLGSSPELQSCTGRLGDKYQVMVHKWR
jgi:hypothetical protein